MLRNNGCFVILTGESGATLLEEALSRSLGSSSNSCDECNNERAAECTCESAQRNNHSSSSSNGSNSQNNTNAYEYEWRLLRRIAVKLGRLPAYLYQLHKTANVDSTQLGICIGSGAGSCFGNATQSVRAPWLKRILRQSAAIGPETLAIQSNHQGVAEGGTRVSSLTSAEAQPTKCSKELIVSIHTDSVVTVHRTAENATEKTAKNVVKKNKGKLKRLAMKQRFVPLLLPDFPHYSLAVDGDD